MKEKNQLPNILVVDSLSALVSAFPCFLHLSQEKHAFGRSYTVFSVGCMNHHYGNYVVP